MHIQTFIGSDQNIAVAVKEAEAYAQQLLGSLGAEEMISVTAQSFIDHHGNGTFAGKHTCFHIITVVYE